jgi:26S proteasome regulatory subunit N3
LQDVARKLGLQQSTDVESIVAKTIRDGSISAALDHEAQVLMSKEVADVYITTEPQQAFHARTAFCMDIHNEAVRAMRYDLPDDKTKGEVTQETPADLEEKIAAALAEGDDDF